MVISKIAPPPKIKSWLRAWVVISYAHTLGARRDAFPPRAFPGMKFSGSYYLKFIRFKTVSKGSKSVISCDLGVRRANNRLVGLRFESPDGGVPLWDGNFSFSPSSPNRQLKLIATLFVYGLIVDLSVTKIENFIVSREHRRTGPSLSGGRGILFCLNLRSCLNFKSKIWALDQ